jgi:hypothetical protein
MILEAWASPPVLLCLNGLVVSFTGAPSAEHSAVLPDFAAEVDAFAAGGCDFSPVTELQRALAQSTASNNGDGVGGAAVNLNKCNQALAVFLVALRIVDAQLLQAKHRHAHAEHLPGTEVPVCLLGIAEIFVERFHENRRRLSVVSRWPFPAIGRRPGSQ